jgi:hypothetical protein
MSGAAEYVQLQDGHRHHHAGRAWLHEVADPILLARARDLDRILVTHDVSTMPRHFAAFLASPAADEPSPGIMFVSQSLPLGQAVEELFAIWSCSRHDEWRNRVVLRQARSWGRRGAIGGKERRWSGAGGRAC